MTILLIGVDGVGKTAVANHLAKHYLANFRVRANVLADNNQGFFCACSTLRDRSVPVTEQTKSFIPSIHFDLDNYDKTETNIIQDSLTVVKLIAYHIACKDKGLVVDLEKLLSLYPKFDKVFFLEARHDIIKERLCNREKHLDHYDVLPFEDPPAFLRANKAQKDIAVNLFGATVIDTSNLTIDETARQVASGS